MHTCIELELKHLLDEMATMTRKRRDKEDGEGERMSDRDLLIIVSSVPIFVLGTNLTLSQFRWVEC